MLSKLCYTRKQQCAAGSERWSKPPHTGSSVYFIFSLFYLGALLVSKKFFLILVMNSVTVLLIVRINKTTYIGSVVGVCK